MRFFALASSLALVGCLSQPAQPVNASRFAEDNDLWMQDNLNAKSAVTQEMFDKIIDAGVAVYKSNAADNNETLTVNHGWTDATVNANTSRWFGSVTINMYGGLARRSEVNPEGFALVLCHELGHAYGGLPYIQAANRLSAEGQSDFYGAGVCLKKVLAKAGITVESGTIVPYWAEKCGTDKSCLTGLSAGMSLGTLLSVLKNEPQPQYETPDTTQVDTTQVSYPATIQCRTDTYHNGVLGLDRPRCWFKN